MKDNGILYSNGYCKLDKLEGIHLSRHHYDDKQNESIFGFKTATNADIKNVY